MLGWTTIVVTLALMNMGDSVKTAPEYKGVDPTAAPYVDKWLEMANERGIVFTNTVTVGFKNINQESSKYRTVALCTRGDGFREIDIDRVAWDKSTETSKTTTLNHELSHCYCGRNHDYGDNKSYGDAGNRKTGNTVDEGFFPDLCPISILYPMAVSDACVAIHGSWYGEEMFQRCKSY